MPFETLSAPEQKPKPGDVTETQDPRRREPERLPGMPVPVSRKLLVQTPFNYEHYEENRKSRWDKVPAVFTVLKNIQDGSVLLGDENGKPVGWVDSKERSVESYEWNTRLAVKPWKDRITLFPSLEHAQLSQGGVNGRYEGNQPVFPVLKSWLDKDGKVEAVLVGAPIGEKPTQGVVYPQWMRMESPAGEGLRLGLFVPEVQLRRYMNRVESLEKELHLHIQPNERGDARNLLTPIAKSAFQLITDQSSIPANTKLEDIAIVLRKFGVPEEVSNKELPTLEGLARANADGMTEFIEKVGVERKRLTDNIQNPISEDAQRNGVSMGSLHNASGKEVRQVFVSLAAVPLLP